MANTILKYNKNRHTFNLNIGGRHFVYRKTREQEVKDIDLWLMGSEEDVYITFKANDGKLHKKVKVDTSQIYTWFNGKDENDEYGDWRTFVWDFPTEFGHIFIQANTGLVYIGKDINDRNYLTEIYVKVEME